MTLSTWVNDGAIYWVRKHQANAGVDRRRMNYNWIFGQEFREVVCLEWKYKMKIVSNLNCNKYSNLNHGHGWRSTRGGCKVRRKMSLGLRYLQHLDIRSWRRRKGNHRKRMRPVRKEVWQGKAVSQKTRKETVWEEGNTQLCGLPLRDQIRWQQKSIHHVWPHRVLLGS